MWWLLALGAVPIGLSAAFWVPLLISNRKREPGKQTLFDQRFSDRAKTEMTLRQGHRDPFKTSKM